MLCDLRPEVSEYCILTEIVYFFYFCLGTWLHEVERNQIKGKSLLGRKINAESWNDLQHRNRSWWTRPKMFTQKKKLLCNYEPITSKTLCTRFFFFLRVCTATTIKCAVGIVLIDYHQFVVFHTHNRSFCVCIVVRNVKKEPVSTVGIQYNRPSDTSIYAFEGSLHFTFINYI